MKYFLLQFIYLDQLNCDLCIKRNQNNFTFYFCLSLSLNLFLCSILFQRCGIDSLVGNVCVHSVFHLNVSEARIPQSCHIDFRAPVV